jgi:membrane-associated phospholipid phosphatase
MSRLSPFARKLLWLSAALLLPIPILMRWVDGPLATFFQGYLETPWWKFFAFITDFANGVIWYSLAVIGLLSAWVRRRLLQPPSSDAVYRARWRAWMFMIVTMASSGIAENAIKFAIGRDRPRFFFHDGSMAFHPFRLRIADSSFPSGHTQSICSAMLSLAIIYTPLRPVFLVIAVLVSSSRVVIGAHYLSDVIAGVWLAVIAVALWRQRFESSGVPLRMPVTATPPQSPAASAPPPATTN